MNKKMIIASLSKIAEQLDNSGLYNEANELTNVLIKVSQMQPKMTANEVVYKVLSTMFGKDYNNDKDIKTKVRDNNLEIRAELDRLSEQFNLDPQKAQQRLSEFMNKSSWHYEAKNPPMHGNKGGASAFDSIQVRKDRPIDKTPGKMGLEAKAFQWIAENGNDGAERAIQKAREGNKTGYPSNRLLKEIVDILQPRVDKYYEQRKKLEGTAAGELGAPIGIRRDPSFDSRPIQ